MDHNQIMRCIICHNDFIGLKILTMCIKCKKGIIAYHKNNGITSMKKHVNVNCYALMKKVGRRSQHYLDKKPNLIKRPPKRGHMYLYL